MASRVDRERHEMAGEGIHPPNDWNPAKRLQRE
jgi:hypothetical protein